MSGIEKDQKEQKSGWGDSLFALVKPSDKKKSGAILTLEENTDKQQTEINPETFAVDANLSPENHKQTSSSSSRDWSTALGTAWNVTKKYSKATADVTVAAAKYTAAATVEGTKKAFKMSTEIAQDLYSDEVMREMPVTKDSVSDVGDESKEVEIIDVNSLFSPEFIELLNVKPATSASSSVVADVPNIITILNDYFLEIRIIQKMIEERDAASSAMKQFYERIEMLSNRSTYIIDGINSEAEILNKKTILNNKTLALAEKMVIFSETELFKTMLMACSTENIQSNTEALLRTLKEPSASGIEDMFKILEKIKNDFRKINRIVPEEVAFKALKKSLEENIVYVESEMLKLSTIVDNLFEKINELRGVLASVESKKPPKAMSKSTEGYIKTEKILIQAIIELKEKIHAIFEDKQIRARIAKRAPQSPDEQALLEAVKNIFVSMHVLASNTAGFEALMSQIFGVPDDIEIFKIAVAKIESEQPQAIMQADAEIISGEDKARQDAEEESKQREREEKVRMELANFDKAVRETELTRKVAQLWSDLHTFDSTGVTAFNDSYSGVSSSAVDDLSVLDKEIEKLQQCMLVVFSEKNIRKNINKQYAALENKDDYSQKKIILQSMKKQLMAINEIIISIDSLKTEENSILFALGKQFIKLCITGCNKALTLQATQSSEMDSTLSTLQPEDATVIAPLVKSAESQMSEQKSTAVPVSLGDQAIEYIASVIGEFDELDDVVQRLDELKLQLAALKINKLDPIIEEIEEDADNIKYTVAEKNIWLSYNYAVVEALELLLDPSEDDFFEDFKLRLALMLEWEQKINSFSISEVKTDSLSLGGWEKQTSRNSSSVANEGLFGQNTVSAAVVTAVTAVNVNGYGV